MSTPSDRTRVTEQIVVDEAETADTAVGPPVDPPVPPPPGYPASEQVVADDVGAPRYVTTATGERVLVDDPRGTRVVTRGRPPLPPDEDPRRWNWLTPALVFILLAALGIVLAALLLTRDDDNKNNTPANTVTTTVRSNTTPAAGASIQVPGLVGQTRSEAESALDRAGLSVVVATVPGAPPAGRVLAQDPAAGQTLKSGDPVRVNVSDGQAAAGGTTPQTTAPAATTPATTPPATTTPATTAPATTESSGGSQPSTPAPTSVSVPSLTGSELKSAVQSLADKDLAAAIQYVPSDEPMGTVVSQSPSAGASSETGTRITLSVAFGPGDKARATVPDTSDQTIEEAVDTLNKADLRLILVKKTVSDRSQAGKVVEQTPQPGAKAPKRAQVLVYMGAFRG